MGHDVWGEHAPTHPNSWQSGLPSFQELLSTIEIQKPQDQKLSQNASVSIYSTMPRSRGLQPNYNVVAVAPFDLASGNSFQPSDKRSTVRSNGPNHFPNIALSAEGSHKSSPYAVSALKSPNFASHHADLDQGPPSGSNARSSPMERKLWHEANQILPLNEKIAFTKTGKLRKRLEKACDACREKKVKCRLRLPKCIHCQKCGYECNAEVILRPNSAGASLQSAAQLPTPTGESDPQGPPIQQNVPNKDADQHFSASESATSAAKAIKRPRNESSASGEDVVIEMLEQPPHKKSMTSTANTTSSEVIIHDVATMDLKTSSRSPSTAAPAIVLNFSLQADPYEVNPRVTLEYTGKFFKLVDKYVTAAIPKAPFLQWVKSCKHKSHADRMMIYSILALGSVLADASASDTYTTALSKIVQEGLTICGEDITFQLAITYLLTTLLFVLRGECNRAWNTCGSTMRTLFGLHFNTEAGIRTTSRSGSWEAQLEAGTLVECRRNLMWTAFIVECLSGCYTTPLSTAAWSEYDLCVPQTETPFHFGESLDLAPLSRPQDPNHRSISADGSGNLTPLTYLIRLATTFHQVANYSHQQKYRATLEHQSFYNEIEKRLHTLQKSLHQFQQQGDKKKESFDLEILYHSIHLHLHRYIRHARLSSTEIRIHVTAAISHAYEMLERVQHVNSDVEMRNSLAEFKITSSCVEFAIASALDVLTAAGKFSDMISTSKLMSLITSGLEVLEDLAQYSQSAKLHRDLVKRRLTAMLKFSTRRTWGQQKAFYFKDPLLLRFGMEQDIIYGITRIQYFQALDSQAVVTMHDFHELRDPS